ncbi:ADP-forming succinate--CoA ligase subunit beta [Candidatus Bathyarchaeota archaeon]|nr:ADP-forming succinate--CoA ligase subunit beta [Candidatus Bathyarchaeota archaeon]NIU80928.1 ADP-forming succinate--CoA ligase subunit beta [Candidatus Bathyarchaeota archaeon]NIV67584.1 ADP-forming succinate--CoA ligase subunit beta [Candidatus Bathyarchaeota archaeon]NIW16107.1 ADP-forming succinate--CoA ligase subunit beta [Candidatus Bathyarchaeota archaeon]NIW34213.1 ADP-forming succinate--CoA ligase subunit beta [Candidatus Bathyarchaeota archaeon]
MKLLEHEAKSIFSKYEIPVPKGALAESPDEAEKIAAELETSVAIKAQIPVAGRGKAGGILFADSPPDVESAARRLLNTQIRGVEVNSLLVEEKVPIHKELYFGITIDRSNRTYVAVASSEGGMEIEEIAARMPEKINKMSIDPLHGFHSYHARQMAHKLGYNDKRMLTLAKILFQMYSLARDYDAELAEMNPVVETSDGDFVAADTRLIIDDNALYRHPEFKDRSTGKTSLASQELEARRSGLAYVKLDGNIGVIGNGAGLVMATLDSIQLYGGEPANFLDVGGGASSEKMATALNIVLSDPRVEVVFINVLGGITRCDDVAKGILEAKRQTGFRESMVIRLMGTNEEEGRQILTEAGVHVLQSMEKAAEKAVQIVKAGG